MRDGTAKRLSRLHTVLYRATRGRVGRRLVDNDMLLLTTVGRNTGKPHTVPLLYLRDGERLVVFASWGGRDEHPEWYLNLAAHPDTEVQVDGERIRMTARTAEGDERARWWVAAQRAYDGYTTYQSRTDRQIPVVILEVAAR
ncbi:MAG: nitroreductase family deazaflavin-dependent oxidoreductase [Acidimicrobiia bacterium]|nr:nitroreductase family deazaflavin-dependent oxidoreductase [Acidimicrobiia bacterium]